jgi:glycosyltransferase involved in cell wall biosynthesis
MFTEVAIIDAGKLGGDLAESLAAGLRHTSHVSIITSDLSDTLDRFRALPGVEVVVLRRSGSSLAARVGHAIRFPILLKRALGRVNPQVVIDTGFSIWSVLPRRMFGRCALAVMVHDPAPHPGLWGRVVDAVLSRSWGSADVVVALSGASGEKLRERTETPVALTTLGVRHRVIEHSPAMIADRRKQLLFWGRLEAYKGIDLLVDAYELAKAVDPELSLRIVGRGTLSPSVHGRLAALGVVFDERWISADEIPDLIASAGLMLLPYTSATQSGPAATAISNGIPTVATDVGGLPEQVRHGVTGRVVAARDPSAFADAILAISGNYEVALEYAAESIRIRDAEELWELRGPALLSQIALITGRMAPLAHCE